MTSICLSMIVKNESHCIKRCLESIKDYIDYWVICDTGSSDNTEEIVKDVLKNIPGEFHHHKWKDFAHNRNLALSLSKKHGDYSLVIDADDYLSKSTKEDFSSLKEDAYKFTIKHNNIIYNRVQLIKNTANAKYIGELHEYLSLDSYIIPILPIEMICTTSGSRSKDPQKYLNDAKIFEKLLKKDPNNARNTFYCAQSYKDANQYQKAIEMYMKRANMNNGWQDEIFISLLEIAKLYNFTYPNDYLNVINHYLRAANFNNKRIEPLVYLSSFCRSINAYESAYFYAKSGLKISKPVDALYIEHECYDWRIQDEVAVSAYYIGNKKEAKNICNWLLSNKLVPDNEKERISKNLTLI